jgi:hypothetical protein
MAAHGGWNMGRAFERESEAGALNSYLNPRGAASLGWFASMEKFWSR